MTAGERANGLGEGATTNERDPHATTTMNERDPHAQTRSSEHTTGGTSDHATTSSDDGAMSGRDDSAASILDARAYVEEGEGVTMGTADDETTATDERAATATAGLLSPRVGALEALLLVAGETATIEALGRALGVTSVEVEAMLTTLDGHYQHTGHGARVLRQGTRAQIATAAAHAGVVARFLGVPEKTKLSPAALETLAIVAYRQPVSRPEVEAVRGVNSDHIMRSLLDAGLLEEQGQADTPGRAALYGTSAGFLETLGFSSLADLPPLDDEQPPFS